MSIAPPSFSPFLVAVAFAAAMTVSPDPAGAAGDVDIDFGNGGSNVIPIDLGGDLLDIASAMVLQPDGKALIVGYARAAAGDFDFAIVRLDAVGQLDMSFGTGGKKTIALNFGGNNDDKAEAVAVRPDGRILVGGYASKGSAQIDMVVVRLLLDGSLDSTFGTSGVARVPFVAGQTGDSVESMLLQLDGKIVLAGSATVGAGIDIDMVVARLHADGSLDTGFGNNGIRTVFFDLGGNNVDTLHAAALQPDGKIVLAGGVEVASSSIDFGVARLTPEGNLDGTFDGDGRASVAFDLGGDEVDSPFAVHLQADGRILLAGTASLGSVDILGVIAVARLRIDGSLDPSFSSDGRAEFSFGFGGSVDFAIAVGTLANGKIVLAAEIWRTGGNVDFGLFRLDADGEHDLIFGNGVATFGFDLGGGMADGPTAMAIRPNGRILLAGTVARGNGDFDLGIVQFLNDAVGPPLFSDGFESGGTHGWHLTVN